MGGDKGFIHDGNNDAGGETSMSIDETNKLRISLGLKPLQLQPTANKPSSSAKPPQLAADKAKQLAERVKASREKRRQQQLLDSTKTLGEEEPELDDIEKWVQKCRATTTTKKQPAAGITTTRNDGDDKDGMRALAGARIRQVDLAEGETTILTLQDKSILNDRGELAEEEDGDVILELENIQTREDKERREAYRAGNKKHAKLLWEEDGKKRSLLDKYDEEEEEMLVLGDRGDVKVDLEKQKLAAKAKLAAAISSAAGGAGGRATTAATGGSDYYTAEEMAAFSKPKKNKKKKDRKLKKKALTAEDIAMLEEEGNARAGGDLGSRGDREERAARETEAAAEEEAKRRARFDAALTKANYASLALNPTYQKEHIEGEDEDDLYASLSKARRLAQQTSGKSTTGAAGDAAVVKPEDIAQQIAQRREAAFMKQRNEPLPSSLLGGDQLTFNDLSGFTRTISAVAASGGGVKKEEDEDEDDKEVLVVGRKQYRRRHHDEDGDEVMRDATTTTMVHDEGDEEEEAVDEERVVEREKDAEATDTEEDAL